MDPSQRLSDLLAGLSAKIAFHGREEKTCAEREAHFREQRTFHAAELERATRCHEALLAAAHTAEEINARPAPAELPAQDLGSPSRPKVTRMVDLVLADLAPDLRFGAKQVVAEIKRRFGVNLSRPADTGAVALVLKRRSQAGRLHCLRRGRPYHQALYTRRAAG
jgi:hypothetical protein